MSSLPEILFTKLKNLSKFDFLDFTSLEKRKFYCEEELRLNKRLAPDTYLDVVAISRTLKGNITLGKGVEIIDYAVRMKKLPADRMLKTLLLKGLVDEKIMDNVAGKIAAFHQQAQTGKAIDEMGNIENIRHNNEENFAETINYINITIPEYQYKFIKDYTEKFLAEKKALFEKRVTDHKIRDGHGDLHLEHICIADEIIIFDCIEFNERFRCGDVAEDVAFLTMDLDFNGYPRHADTFIQSYIKHSGDTDMLTLLNFYRCYYAYVRGKVTSFRLDQKEIQEMNAFKLQKTRHDILILPYTYAARLDKPVLILTAGLMGSGKSYQARASPPVLARRLFAPIYCAKNYSILSPPTGVMKISAGVFIPTILPVLLYDKAYDLAAQKIKQGKAVIIDASFKRRSERQKLCKSWRKISASIFIFWNASVPMKLSRKSSRKKNTGK
jgi:aminoglycoside phosphotransferase family enzyme